MMRSFGEIIKQARLTRELELKDVQFQTGIDYSLLSRLENAERIPSREQVFHLADFYEIDRHELLVAWRSDKILAGLLGDEIEIIVAALDNVRRKIDQNSRLNKPNDE